MTINDNSGARSYSGSGSSRRLHLMVVLVGILVVGAVLYSFYIGERINQLEEPLVDAVMEISVEAVAADLMFKEYLKRNINISRQAIWENLNQSIWYLEALYRQNSSSARIFKPTHSDRTHDMIVELQQQVTKLGQATRAKLEQGPSAGATDLKIRYEKDFQQFLAQIDLLRERFASQKTASLRKFRLVHIALVLFCIVLFIAMDFVIRSNEKRKSQDMHRLQAAHRKLTTEIDERVRAESELHDAHDRLEERVHIRTAELTASNEALTAEVAERRRAERMLKQSRAMLKAVFDGIVEPLILMDKDMRVKMMNAGAVAYYNLETSDKMTGALCYRAFDADDFCEGCEIPEAVREGRAATMERRNPINAEQIEQVTIYPLGPQQGMAGDAIIRLQDVTNAKQMEKHLIQSEKLASLGVLVSSIAHEINNPNNFVTFNLPILKDYISKLLSIADNHEDRLVDRDFFNMSYAEFRSDAYKLIENIENGARRITTFVENLREFAKGGDRHPKKWIDPRKVIDKVVNICHSQIKKNVDRFDINVDSEISRVFTDPNALEQIIFNLVVNAIQAVVKPGAAITITVGSGKTWKESIVIEVKDNGEGIDATTRRHIFDPFFTTKAADDGTGLGLYVCHNLVSKLGGSIDVESDPGKGTRFTVYLHGKERRLKPRK